MLNGRHPHQHGHSATEASERKMISPGQKSATDMPCFSKWFAVVQHSGGLRAAQPMLSGHCPHQQGHSCHRSCSQNQMHKAKPLVVCGCLLLFGVTAAQWPLSSPATPNCHQSSDQACTYADLQAILPQVSGVTGQSECFLSSICARVACLHHMRTHIHLLHDVMESTCATYVVSCLHMHMSSYRTGQLNIFRLFAGALVTDVTFCTRLTFGSQKLHNPSR